MALANDNVITRNMSGSFGRQVVFRNRNGKTIACKPPVFRKDLVPTPVQEENRTKFRVAQAYAKKAIKNDAVKLAYQAMAKPGQAAFNVAFTDAYLAPEILGIVTENYKGLPNHSILVRALDDFKVTSVKVQVFSPAGALLEEGDAVEDENTIDWTYLATTANPNLPGTTIKATAMDVPGNKTVLELTL
ncbi:hypothetical protein [Flavihumibacter fluvii]|uniref:hypothetical protein n=1 Tax=Flavihumibacter fluvii TaxID=2838157 RepID=UPI001BDE9A15|nr:hypothetical protein [Flavihumibacter fluvii]ULQ51712.1 hypothetical protein KJS93_16615 [Flavihumibacter fluvii]